MIFRAGLLLCHIHQILPSSYLRWYIYKQSLSDCHYFTSNILFFVYIYIYTHFKIIYPQIQRLLKIKKTLQKLKKG